MKSEQWVADREFLRGRIQMQKPSGGFATFLYCLVSHMRGKLHMRWYQKYHGGFSTKYRHRNASVTPLADIPAEVKAAYSGLEREYYVRCSLLGLEDQAAWIKQYLEVHENGLSSDIEEVAVRVLNSTYAVPLLKTG